MDSRRLVTAESPPPVDAVVEVSRRIGHQGPPPSSLFSPIHSCPVHAPPTGEATPTPTSSAPPIRRGVRLAPAHTLSTIEVVRPGPGVPAAEPRIAPHPGRERDSHIRRVSRARSPVDDGVEDRSSVRLCRPVPGANHWRCLGAGGRRPRRHLRHGYRPAPGVVGRRTDRTRRRS